MSLVAIIGMNNPVSARPEHALWPEPAGCAGWRLWKMLEARTGATQCDYLRAFHRYNLCAGPFHSESARERWGEIVPDLTEKFSRVVLLGNAVRRASGLLLPQVYISGTICCIPHPSGLNRWYNDEINRQIVEMLLEELYTEAVAA